jgi:LysM repeat protein
MARLMSRLMNTARLVGVIVGVPWLLITKVGWCLPRNVTLNDVGNAWTMGDLDPSTVVKALACAVWITWALAIVSFCVHLGSKVLHVTARRPVFVPKRIFAVTGRWVGGVALTATTTMMAMGGSAMAATNAKPLVEVSRQLQATSTSPTEATLLSPVNPVPVAATNTARTWTVKPGDTLWEIAEAQLGDGAQWRSIEAANPSLAGHRDDLPVGMVLVIPDGSSTTTPAPVPVATQTPVSVPVLGTVTVEKGDHFWKISDDVLSQAYGRPATDAEISPYWHDMVESNKNRVASGDVNLIFVGERYDVQLPELPADVVDRTITTPNVITRLDTPGAGDVATNWEPASDPVLEPVSEPVIVASTPVPVVGVAPEPAMVAAPVAELRASASDSDSSDVSLLAFAAVGMSAIGAGAVLLGLRRRRARAERTRDIAEALEDPSEDLLTLLSRIRAIATPDVAVTMDGVQRLLRRQLMVEHKPAPAIAVARAGRNGVELLLEIPNRHAPAGFVSVDEGACWVLSPDVTPTMLEEARANETSLMPGLVSVGSNEIGSVLVDVERLGALEIRSDDPHGSGIGVLASMAAEWEGAPWLDLDETEIFGIGLPESIFSPYERLRLIDESDVDLVVRTLCDTARNEAVAYPAGKHVERAATSAFVFGPKIVLVGPGQAEIAKNLAEAALHSGSGLCVVALDQLPQGSSCLVVTGGTAVLEPYGLDLDHVAMLSPEMAVGVGAVVDSSDNVLGTIPWPELWQLQTTTTSLVESFTASPSENAVEIVGSFDGDDHDRNDGDDFEDTEFDDERFSGQFDQVSELGELTLEQFVNSSCYDLHVVGSNDPVHDDDDDPDGGPGGGGLPTFTGEPTDAVALSEAVDGVSQAEEVLADLLAPTGSVLFRMLSEAMPTLTGTTFAVSGKTAPRAVELVTFLSLRAPAPINRVLEAMWPMNMETRTVVKAVSRIRGAIAPGNILLASDKYVLDGIDSDWVRFQKLIEAANTFDSNGALLLLRNALDLVQCRPFEGRKGSSWEWLEHGFIESNVRVAIVDASEALGELALAAGDAALTLWACEKARLCEPNREATHQLRMRAFAMLGDRDALRREVKYAQASAMIDDPFAEISTNMKQLLRVLEAQFTDTQLSETAQRHTA